jgi:hypothetical protein
VFELLWFEVFSGTPEELHHVCQSKKSFASKALAKYGSDVPPLFVVTLIVPGTPVVAGVQSTGDDVLPDSGVPGSGGRYLLRPNRQARDGAMPLALDTPHC